MKVKIEFSCDNAAFEDDLAYEASKSLTRLSNNLQGIGYSESFRKRGVLIDVFDSNGNRVGECRIEPED